MCKPQQRLFERVKISTSDEYDSRQQSDKKTHAKQRDRLITTINQMYNKVDLFSREKQLVKVAKSNLQLLMEIVWKQESPLLPLFITTFGRLNSQLITAGPARCDEV